MAGTALQVPLRCGPLVPRPCTGGGAADAVLGGGGRERSPAQACSPRSTCDGRVGGDSTAHGESRFSSSRTPD